MHAKSSRKRMLDSEMQHEQGINYNYRVSFILNINLYLYFNIDYDLLFRDTRAVILRPCYSS